MGSIEGANGAEGGEQYAEEVGWIKTKIRLICPLGNDESDKWLDEAWTEDHKSAVINFFTEIKAPRLFAYLDAGKSDGLAVSSAPSSNCKKLLYFIRDPAKFLTPENLSESVQYGVLQSNLVESIYGIMSNVYLPSMLKEESWPDTVKKQFTGQLHKFMASLTEVTYERKGKTVLYIPQETTDKKKDKDLIQRLESILIHWTRQVKEVVNNQDNSELGEDAGPLAEIEFWRSRSVDLGGIREQLEYDKVKDIVKILESSKSSYLAPFLSLSNNIQRQTMAAEDNLKFLLSLEKPCQLLAKASPKEIPHLLPKLLHCIRMIWNISRFYNTPERLTGLLRKVSNEIIQRCCAKISLAEIFEGDVENCMVLLQESIKAGEEWKQAYLETANAVSKSEAKPWDFDVSSIFAHTDAFVQRCRDMLEVCEAQLQFAPKTDLPSFGGTHGPEVTKSLQDIQLSFQKLVASLKSLKYNILDVKATSWHDDYNIFKSGVKDLEVMLTNVIVMAFESVSTLVGRIELLLAFQSIAKRESIKRCVEKKTAESFSAFLQELNVVKKHFDQTRTKPPTSPHLPKYAGAAMWSLSLSQRLGRPMDLLMRVKDYLPQVPEFKELHQSYTLTTSSMEQYMKNQHLEWFNSIDTTISLKLEANLIVQEKDESGLLRVNFDKVLLSLFHEVQYWERLRLEIPYIAMEIQSQRERFRILQEHVLLVVKDYNAILTSLDAEERLLFADRIHYLDRKVSPGINKLLWVSAANQLDYFIKEARKFCKEVMSTVDYFKSSHRRIESYCRVTSRMTLISIEKKRVYENDDFTERQVAHRNWVKDSFDKAFKDISDTMTSTFEIFANDSDEVKEKWVQYTQKIDKRMEDSLRLTVKRSLQDLSRSLNGDAKTEVIPMFGTNLILGKNDLVELKPSLQDLYNMVLNVSNELISTVKNMPRLYRDRTVEEMVSFFNLISNDEDTTLKTVSLIANGVTSLAGQVQQFLKYWEKKYSHIWDVDKDSFIEGYRKANHPLSVFEAEINKYKELQEQVLSEDSTSNMASLRIDCTPLKQTLVHHCETWVTKLTQLLNDIARQELESVHDYFKSNTEILKKPVLSLDMLADTVNLQKKLLSEKSKVQGSFAPILEKYASLESFEVTITPEEVQMKELLPIVWNQFEKDLDETAVELENAKENFRDKLSKMVENFAKEVTDDREVFTEAAPFEYAGEESVDAAFKYIEESKQKVADSRKTIAELKSGLDIFGMQQPQFSELNKSEKDLDLLTTIWGIVKDWNSRYNTWKDGMFRDLEVENMEEEAIRINKRIVKIGREIKSWSIWKHIKETVDAFKRTMPLIVDLRNPAMRERHWGQLMDTVGEKFDPHGSDFTLGSVIRMQLEQHADAIRDMSGNASKELAIEQSLEQIEETWKTLDLDMVPYKDEKAGIFKLRSTEDLFTALEDNTVTLSTMKASKFFLVFEKQITQWEKSLSLVSETIEVILQVQRNWMYLENIFIGSDSIHRELPQESAMFEAVHFNFIAKMKEIHDINNVLNAALAPGMLDNFMDMDTKLEKIQKSLDNYLESKRQQFPRFYFLSSDDLLEILGQAKDPLNVQPHLKKCFEGVAKLDMKTPDSTHRFYEAHGIHAKDKEYLPFISPIVTQGRPEDWLNDIEAGMFATTKKHLLKTLEDSKGMKKEKWVKEYHGQMLITAGQIIWTAECEKALGDSEGFGGGGKAGLKLLKKKWVSYLNKLTFVTRSRLNKIERNKVVALITIEVHARDVIEKLAKMGCQGSSDFNWVSQLRFYWDREQNDCVVKQVLSVFTYGYEYQGNNGRLVITPLTDRCYMTLGAAMFTRRGGNPLGPAGTGKTETVKDFGKALARYVIVFNCSDGVDYKMTGKMFSGLAQTGAWACLDEFNRIEVEVLSVVATQISLVMQAIKERKTRFNFLGTEIRLIPTCGIFVTMNPGYAGRSELPDNLKAIVRPVSMMVPDFALIAEIMMYSEGFNSAKNLAKKMIAIMELSQQQLSKQDHYDYGLRSFVIPIARAAGALKRADPDVPEEVIMYRTMIDLIKPKLVFLDLPLFMALLSDLFPGVELPQNDGGALRETIVNELKAHNLQPVPEFITKIIQVYDCKVARHGNMIVGKTGAGKSEAWKCLQRTLGKLHAQFPKEEHYAKVHVHTINPLALSNDEMYGCFDAATHEWQDGILARLMRNVCKDESLDQKWILFDGPVDTLWIESMNTLLDDNKLLTLLSGERISMVQQVSVLFEVEDLSQASPATVSRAGMIYLNVEDLSWRPFIKSWLRNKSKDSEESKLVEPLKKLTERYIDPILDFKRRQCKEHVPVDPLSGVRSLTILFDSLCRKNRDNVNNENMAQMIDMWFLFSLTWSLGGSLGTEDRKKFDSLLREMDALFPPTDTVFEYTIDYKKSAWMMWEEKLPQQTYRPPADTPFFKILVPTIDTLRTQMVSKVYVSESKHLLLMGEVGVGKTMVAQSVLDDINEQQSCMFVNFSAQTSSNSLQDTIEGRLEKRTKGVFAPAGGKHLITFIDDLNMPQKSKFGFIPPLELLKLWVDNGFWYDRQKCELKHVKDMQLMAAMAPPGGGRNAFSQRILACFNVVNMTPPSESQLKRIYSTFLTNKLMDFDDEIKPMADSLTQASIQIYSSICSELLPTPSKCHYLFNTRDLAKVVQGVMQATKQYYDNPESMIQLWVHETFRIYGDRMWDPADKEWLKSKSDECLNSLFGTSWNSLFDTGECPPFVSFMQTIDNPPYEAVTDEPALKAFLVEKLEDYALEPGKSAMDLVLFRDALFHVCKIHRILMQPRGNALLVGVGGSGRKSLAKLASYVAELKCFQIEISKNYRLFEFREDVKNLYRLAGCSNKPTVFLFDETQIVSEVFLEDINNILTSGEVPNLFPKDEITGVLDAVRPDAKKVGMGDTQDQLYAFFQERVRNNLHIILCLSPVGESFRERVRMFPGLVNCTTIDWFTEWPEDALYEVATKQLEEENLGSDEVKEAICQVFVTVHSSTSTTSTQMLQQLKRHNYVTPTNYLEFVSGYSTLLKEKRMEIGDKANKLKGGLQKLDETAVQVTEMQVLCQEKKVVVAQAKRDCEELLVEIVQDKRTADEQEKQVNAEAQKIAGEAEEANKIAEECQAGLDKALPALRAAEEALNVLTKKDMSELKAYSKPPALVEVTMNAVLCTLKRPTNWDEAKKQLGDTNFLQKLIGFDKDKLDSTLLKKIGKYTTNKDFTPDNVGRVSLAAKGLCLWVYAMEVYGHVAKEIAPKRAKLKNAQDQLAKKQAQLAKAQDALAEVLAKVQALRDKYDESTASKEALQKESDELEIKLQRAEKLVTGLAGEKSRWESSITEYEQQLEYIPGDVVLASAFLSYAGPFPSEYRDILVQDTWYKQVKELNIPSSPNFNFALFLANPSDVRDWNIQGLPSDSFSTENGVLVTRGNRWPLMVDPQGQAKKWIKNMEGPRGCKLLSQNMGDMMMRTMESSLQFGNPVLLQDILEEIDPALEPVLAKSFIKKGNSIIIKLGEKEIDYNPEFKLYITTKLSNPHYTPEISTKSTIVNFAVKEQGLEAQLLNIVVQKERPDLDKQKNDLIVKVAQGKRTQSELEDKILYMLSTAEGSLLDNVELINTLDESKTTWEEVSESLKIAEVTSKEIFQASQEYRPCSIRAAILYFVLYDLSLIDPMYQFSLEAYTTLFVQSIARSTKSETLSERIKHLNDYHTYAVYKYTSRGLFEKHKMLLSLQICVRILQKSNQINNDEWQFFLKGGQVLDRAEQVENPAPTWISEEAWDNITELENLPSFKDIVSSFQQNPMIWEEWYRNSELEVCELPGEWESKCSELQKMILIRSLRPDRVIFAATTFVANSLGRKFVEPPVLDLQDVYNESDNKNPLIFVLSPGVDPTDNLRRLAAENDLGDKFFSVALGQGQAPVATKLIEDGLVEGFWVFLANCHLMTSWLPKLDKMIEDFEKKDVHPNFRLWLSSSPNPHFPIAILQRGLKMTTEPPKGLRANLLRLYNNITEESFQECKTGDKYCKLLFTLCYFHAVLLERRKFRTLGLNIAYDFNDTDFKVSDDLLKTYLDEYVETPWDALKYLIAEANYGGRVTDELDRRILHAYLNQFYCEDVLTVQNYTLSTLPTYYVPENGSLQSYRDYISTLPPVDHPEALGQHPNADISYMIEDTRILLESMLMIQPRAATSGVTKREDLVDSIASDILQQLPQPWILEDVMKAKADDPSPLHVVLFQEVERYNVLINNVRLSCEQLRMGIKGLVVMSADLDEVFESLYAARVPPAWLKSYPSLKSLGPWTRDLMNRLAEFNTWIDGSYPKVFWLSGFTYPTSFLTAVLQTTARKNSVPIDTLSFEFTIVNMEEKEIQQGPKEGVYIKGAFLEGAGWDFENGCLVEPEPMELIVPMPIIHFKPVENKKKVPKGVYLCPMYLYPVRTGSRERPSFVINVELKSGSNGSEHWVKRGTAVLLSLAT